MIHDFEVFLNGEAVKVEDELRVGNVSHEYAEFAKGPSGYYVDFDHAVKRHKVLDAIERSSREGKAVSYLPF
jgi:predicted dehydrogenase